jgi:polyferredoxin
MAPELLMADREVPASGLEPAGPKVRVKLVRRSSPDHSQLIRRGAQGLFVALNIYLGIHFYLWVRQFEPGGQAGNFSRPAGVEGWLPIAGMMNLKLLLVTGHIPVIHPAAMFLLLAFLSMSVLFRKSFCSWLCPIGTLAEALWKLGLSILKSNWILPRWIDIPLRGLKYILFGFFLYAVLGMPAETIEAFFSGPYGLVADVKMLNFFRHLGQTAAITIAVLLGLSFLYRNFWCRYLCPYGALLGLASLLSPAKIRRNTERCIDCAKCARACPSLLPVDRLVNIQSAECTACLECVAVCPAEDALEFSYPKKSRVQPWGLAAAIAMLFFGLVGFAKWSGHWNTHIPDQVYRSIIPRTDELDHPR